MKLEIVIPLILLVFLNIDISYSSYPNHLASKLTNHYKDQLQNKSFSELVEICYYVDKYAKFTSHSKYDILAIIYHESRFNPLALNKIDNGVGLGQITGLNSWWKEYLSWIQNPYSIEENIRGTIYILSFMQNKYKTRYMKIKRYNGSTKKSDKYAMSVIRTSNIIKNIDK